MLLDTEETGLVDIDAFVSGPGRADADDAFTGDSDEPGFDGI